MAASGGPLERAIGAARSRPLWAELTQKRQIARPRSIKQQSMVLVPLDSVGLKIERMLTGFGYDHAAHGHGDISFENVRVPVSNMLLGEDEASKLPKGGWVRGAFTTACAALAWPSGPSNHV